MEVLDRFRGCLIGSAAGDALGYPVEFMDEFAIEKQFGGNGIRSFIYNDGKAPISDDTQLMLFTVDGLLRVTGGGEEKTERYIQSV